MYSLNTNCPTIVDAAAYSIFPEAHRSVSSVGGSVSTRRTSSVGGRISTHRTSSLEPIVSVSTTHRSPRVIDMGGCGLSLLLPLLLLLLLLILYHPLGTLLRHSHHFGQNSYSCQQSLLWKRNCLWWELNSGLLAQRPASYHYTKAESVNSFDHC